METFEIGHLYRAISEVDLIEVQPLPPVEGLKLLVNPQGVKTLRAIQKNLKKALGQKLPFPIILNALLATTAWEAQIDAISSEVLALFQLSQDEF